MDLKTLLDLFIVFEKEHSALQWTLKDVHAWRLVRFDIFQALVSEKKLFEFAHPHLKSKKNKFKKYRDNIKYIFPNPSLSNKDYLFLPHSRNINGKDIYSHPLMDYLGFDNVNIFYPSKPPSPYKNSIVLGWPSLKISLSNLALNRFRYDPFPKYKDRIIAFSNAFRAFFQSNIKVEKIIRRELYRFEIYEKAYLKSLKALKPKHIFLVAHYGHFSMISAAKKLNIPTHEIQHGTISTNHMGYYFPNDEKPPYMPDTFLCHGEYWTRKSLLPQCLNTKVIGAAHVSKLIESSKNKIKKQILIFSQGTVATDLFAFAKKAAELASDYHFIYRLHPSELQESYPRHNLPLNFEIKHETNTFFDDLKQSEFIATVYSTTIYEAMACGAKGIVIGLNGHNAVLDIVDNGDAVLAKTPQDFVTFLTRARPCKQPEKYYASVNYAGLSFAPNLIKMDT